MKSGIWLAGRLHATALPGSLETVIAQSVTSAAEEPVRVTIDGQPHLLFSKRLNPGSSYPPAFEACVYPLSDLVSRQRQLRWQVLGAGSVLLLLGWAGSHFVAGRLSAPVEKLAVDSEENRTQRARAEAALEMTSAELQRSARFSADASHQLKTPVTVLRAGLEELLSRENLTPEECNEVSALIHQTFRLSSLIEDLLLLSRMDAGRLKLDFAAVNLSALIDASLDDLSALPDEHDVAVETDYPADLHILGEKRYTAIILQNLLENARKYNLRRGGRIRIAAKVEGDAVVLALGNSGHAISAEGQAHIFERFHRGVMGENLPGYGLGLNLARELARLHQGDLRLVRSDETWTEFEVRFRLAHSVRPFANSA
jgi:signal transduction histidine kinase